MTELRLYSVRTGRDVDECDGCHAEIPPHSRVVLREDRALFCEHGCARKHDDAPVEQGAIRVAV